MPRPAKPTTTDASAPTDDAGLTVITASGGVVPFPTADGVIVHDGGVLAVMDGTMQLAVFGASFIMAARPAVIRASHTIADPDACAE